MTMTTEQDGHLVRVRDAPALPSEVPSTSHPSSDPDEATVRELIVHLAQVEHEMRNISPISPRYTVLDGRERYLVAALNLRRVTRSATGPEPDRILGRTTFEEHLRRGRDRRRS